MTLTRWMRARLSDAGSRMARGWIFGKLHLPPVAELPEDQQAMVRELIAESTARAKQRVVVGTLVRQRKPIGG